MKKILCWLFGHKIKYLRDDGYIFPNCQRCGEYLVDKYAIAVIKETGQIFIKRI